MAHSRTRVRYPLRLRARRFDLPLRRRRVPALPKTSTSANPTPSVVTATAGVLSPTAATGSTATASVVTAVAGVLTPNVVAGSDPFLETFDDSDALLRGVMANFRGQWDDETASNLDGQDTTQGAGPDVPDNIHVTGGKLVIESGMQNYGDSQWRSLTPFAGTGTIEVDVEDSGLSPETQVVILLTDRPYAMTGFEGENANTPHPQYGIGIYNGYIIRTWSDYDQTDYYQGGTPGPPNGTREIGVEQHWVVNFNSTHMWVTIDSDDINVGEDIGGGVRRVPLPDGFELSGSRVVLGTHNHASRKYTPFVDTCEVIFDNLEYEGLPAERSAIVAPSTSSERFGWQLVENGVGTPIVHSTPTLSKGTGTDAWLLLNVGCFADDIDSGSLLHYSLNSNTEHTAAFRVATNEIGTFTVSTPVDIAEVVNGVNTIEVSISDPVANAGSIRYANLSLVVAGGTGSTDANVSATVVTAVASVLAPAAGAGAGVTATVVTATAGVLSPSVATGSTATATVVTATAGVLSPTVTTSGNATATPSVVTATAGALAATVATGSTVSATVVTAPAGVVAPAAGTSHTATASVVTATAGVLSPGVSASGNTTVNATVVTAAASVAAPALTTGATASPSAVTAVASVLSVVVIVGQIASDVYRTRNSYREASSRGYREPNSRGYREPRSTGYGGN